jgi:P-type Cu+ transporter
VRAAQEQGISLAQLENFEAIPGHGITAIVEGRMVALGNLTLMRDYSVDLGALEGEVARLQGEGKTAMLVAADGVALGVIAVADTLKPASREAVAALKREGIAVAMLKGDNERTARSSRRAPGPSPRSSWSPIRSDYVVCGSTDSSNILIT